jgi:hypothetical protein
MVYFQPEIPFWVNLEGLRLENDGIFNDHWKYFADIWDIL